MSKVICDVCGTAYPETATTCPICGSAKKSGEQTAAGNSPDAAQGASYTYVKGGRFSRKNVRRMNQRGGRAQETRVPVAERKSRSAAAPDRNGNGDDEGVNKGLVAVVIVLLLAIVAVLIYIGVRFLTPDANVPTVPVTNVDPTPTGKPDPTEPPTDANVPCTDLILSMENISFTEVGGTYTLVATPAPQNTTDSVTFASADDAVATVTQDGVVCATGFGETTITVSCGDVVKQCKVLCISNFTFEFNTNPRWNDPITGYADTTIDQGESWKAYKGTLSVPVDQLKWTIDDETIATIQNGIVTAVSPGRTLIHVEFGGKRYTCIFRCKATEGTSGGDEYVSTPSDTQFSFRWAVFKDGKWDTTIQGGVGSTWKAYSDGINPADVAWSTKDPAIATVGADGVVTAVAPGQTELYAVYNGATFTCIVRVPA